MTPLWTWRGQFFGYRNNKHLFTHSGQCVGMFDENRVYDHDGRYLGEVVDQRLICDLEKRKWVGGRAPRLVSRRVPRQPNRPRLSLSCRYTDFPSADAMAS